MNETDELLRLFWTKVYLFSAQKSRGELQRLNHVTQQSVDLILTATKVTTFDKVIGLLAPATVGSVQFERPQRVWNVFEVGAHGEDFVNQILHANHTMATQGGLNQVIRGDGRPLSVDLKESTLVDQFANWFQIGSTPGNVGLYKMMQELLKKRHARE